MAKTSGSDQFDSIWKPSRAAARSGRIVSLRRVIASSSLVPQEQRAGLLALVLEAGEQEDGHAQVDDESDGQHRRLDLDRPESAGELGTEDELAHRVEAE